MSTITSDAPMDTNSTSNQTGRKAIVIGAGFGGLAAALRLRAKGYEVTVLDRAKMPGDRAQVFEAGGYRHDAGPTVITAPFNRPIDVALRHHVDSALITEPNVRSHR